MRTPLQTACRALALGCLMFAAQASDVAPIFTNPPDQIFIAYVNEGDLPLASNLSTTLSSEVRAITFNAQTGAYVFGPGQGVAVVATALSPGASSAGSGVWQYQTQGAATWTTIPAVGDFSALHLPFTVPVPIRQGVSPTLIRFLADPNFNGQATMDVRAWDGSSSTMAFSTASTYNSTSTNYAFGGNGTAYSAEVRQLVVDITAVNQAPTGASATTLTPWAVGDARGRTTNVVALVAAATDVDVDQFVNGLGLGITAINQNFTGRFEYSIDGAVFFPIATIPPGQVLCLPSGSVVRTTPPAAPTAAATPGAAVFSARVWDGSVDPGQYDGNFSTGFGLRQLAAGPILRADISDSGLFNLVDVEFAAGLGGTTTVVTQPIIPNQTPAITDTANTTITALARTVIAGSTATANLLVSDPDSTTWTWAWTNQSGDPLLGVVINPGVSAGASVTVTITAGQAPTSTARVLNGLLRVTDNSGNAAQIPLTVTIPANAAPVIQRSGATVTSTTAQLTAGSSTSVALTALDLDSSSFAWSATTTDSALTIDLTANPQAVTALPRSQASTLGLSSQNQAVTVTLTSSHIGLTTARQSTAVITLNDNATNTATCTITVTINPAATNNQPPIFVRLPGTVAVAGQPYTGYVVASDADSPGLLTVAATGVPAGLTFTNTGNGTGQLTGTPVAGSSTISFYANDQVNSAVVTSFTLVAQTVPAQTQAVPTITPGSAEAPSYAAIAPGSTGGFTLLQNLLTPLGATTARGFWWDGSAYQDVVNSLPTTSRQPTSAVFVASTVPLAYAPSASPLPIPMDIRLNPGWNFIGLPPLWTGSQVVTSHAWTDFALSETDGTLLTSATAVRTALAPSGSTTVPGPYAYDPPPGAGFAQVTTLTSGRGYWLRNRSSRALNLVRVASSDSVVRVGSITSQSAAAALRVASAASAEDLPPAPPSARAEATPLAVDSSGGSCGSGIGAILLFSGGALLWRRRRSHV